MLIEFRVRNFRSIREEQVLSLVASNDASLEGNCIQAGKLRLLKTIGIYGPNASGKTNILKAMRFVKGLVMESAAYEPGKSIKLEPFLFDNESKKKDSFFELTFFHQKIRFQYGLTATGDRIHDEWLIAYPLGSPQLWFQRTYSEKTGKTNWKFGPNLKGDRKKLAAKTRDNALFLSVAAQWNNEQLMTVYNWFSIQFRFILSGYEIEAVTANMLFSFDPENKKDNTLQKFITEFLKDADLGVNNIDVKKKDLESIEYPKELHPDMRKVLIDRLKEEPPLSVEMTHRNAITKKEFNLGLEEEAAGTQRLFDLVGPLIDTAVHGYTVILDELEKSLHPHITRELLKFTNNPQFSTKGAQLIFATHDTTLLDPDIFRRDQIWFTEKDENGATRLYSMWDYKERKPRKGESMQKGYLSGRYGAIPIIERFGLNES